MAGLPELAVSADGSRALAVWRDGGFRAAWWADGTWQPSAFLGYSEESSTVDIALSADGSEAVIVWDNRPDEVWEVDWTRWTGSGWTPTAKIDDSPGEFWASDVAMSADGRTVMASYLARSGRLKVRRLEGAGWVPLPEFAAGGVDPGKCEDRSRIDLSDDGRTTLVTCRARVIQNGRNLGMVLAAIRQGSSWSRLERVSPEARDTGPIPDAFTGNHDADLTASGNRAYVAFALTSQSGGRAMLAQWRGGRWRSVRDLGAGEPGVDFPPLQVVASPHGSHVAVAWVNRRGSGTPLMLRAAVKSGKRWMPANTLGEVRWPGAGALALGGNEVTVVWPGPDESGAGQVSAISWTDGKWGKAEDLGPFDDYSDTRLALAADGVTGLAAWKFDDTIRQAFLERTAKASSVKVTAKKISRNKVKAKIRWSAPKYAQSYKVKLTKPASKKHRSWQSRNRADYTAKLKRGRKYTVKIKATTRQGWGPVKKVKFST